MQDLRNEIVMTMLEAGLPVECQHHEVATAGQAEIDMKFSPLTKMADQLMISLFIPFFHLQSFVPGQEAFLDT